MAFNSVSCTNPSEVVLGDVNDMMSHNFDVVTIAVFYIL